MAHRNRTDSPGNSNAEALGYVDVEHRGTGCFSITIGAKAAAVDGDTQTKSVAGTTLKWGDSNKKFESIWDTPAEVKRIPIAVWNEALKTRSIQSMLDKDLLKVRPAA